MLTEILEKIFPSSANKDNSRQQVKQRLQLVLAYDRLDLTPQNLAAMRQEIIEVINRYVEVDIENLDFTLENNQRVTALIANVPVRRGPKEKEDTIPLSFNTESTPPPLEEPVTTPEIPIAETSPEIPSESGELPPTPEADETTIETPSQST
jgi:cell division topological specificity factor